jgi:hypothetical protein
LAAFLAPSARDAPPVCQGPLLDRHSFEFDLQSRGFKGPPGADARPKGG